MDVWPKNRNVLYCKREKHCVLVSAATATAAVLGNWEERTRAKMRLSRAMSTIVEENLNTHLREVNNNVLELLDAAGARYGALDRQGRRVADVHDLHDSGSELPPETGRRSASATDSIYSTSATTATTATTSATMTPTSNPSTTSNDIDSITFCSSRKSRSFHYAPTKSSLLHAHAEPLRQKRRLRRHTLVSQILTRKSISNNELCRQEFAVYPVQLQVPMYFNADRGVASTTNRTEDPCKQDANFLTGMLNKSFNNNATIYYEPDIPTNMLAIESHTKKECEIASHEKKIIDREKQRKAKQSKKKHRERRRREKYRDISPSSSLEELDHLATKSKTQQPEAKLPTTKQFHKVRRKEQICPYTPEQEFENKITKHVIPEKYGKKKKDSSAIRKMNTESVQRNDKNDQTVIKLDMSREYDFTNAENAQQLRGKEQGILHENGKSSKAKRASSLVRIKQSLLQLTGLGKLSARKHSKSKKQNDENSTRSPSPGRLASSTKLRGTLVQNTDCGQIPKEFVSSKMQKFFEHDITNVHAMCNFQSIPPGRKALANISRAELGSLDIPPFIPKTKTHDSRRRHRKHHKTKEHPKVDTGTMPCDPCQMNISNSGRTTENVNPNQDVEKGQSLNCPLSKASNEYYPMESVANSSYDSHDSTRICGNTSITSLGDVSNLMYVSDLSKDDDDITIPANQDLNNDPLEFGKPVIPPGLNSFIESLYATPTFETYSFLTEPYCYMTLNTELNKPSNKSTNTEFLWTIDHYCDAITRAKPYLNQAQRKTPFKRVYTRNWIARRTKHTVEEYTDSNVELDPDKKKHSTTAQTSLTARKSKIPVFLNDRRFLPINDGNSHASSFIHDKTNTKSRIPRFVCAPPIPESNNCESEFDTMTILITHSKDLLNLEDPVDLELYQDHDSMSDFKSMLPDTQFAISPIKLQDSQEKVSYHRNIGEMINQDKNNEMKGEEGKSGEVASLHKRFPRTERPDRLIRFKSIPNIAPEKDSNAKLATEAETRLIFNAHLDTASAFESPIPTDISDLANVPSKDLSQASNTTTFIVNLTDLEEVHKNVFSSGSRHMTNIRFSPNKDPEAITKCVGSEVSQQSVSLQVLIPSAHANTNTSLCALPKLSAIKKTACKSRLPLPVGRFKRQVKNSYTVPIEIDLSQIGLIDNSGNVSTLADLNPLTPCLMSFAPLVGSHEIGNNISATRKIVESARGYRFSKIAKSARVPRPKLFSWRWWRIFLKLKRFFKSSKIVVDENSGTSIESLARITTTAEKRRYSSILTKSTSFMTLCQLNSDRTCDTISRSLSDSCLQPRALYSKETWNTQQRLIVHQANIFETTSNRGSNQEEIALIEDPIHKTKEEVVAVTHYEAPTPPPETNHKQKRKSKKKVETQREAKVVFDVPPIATRYDSDYDATRKLLQGVHPGTGLDMNRETQEDVRRKLQEYERLVIERQKKNIKEVDKRELELKLKKLNEEAEEYRELYPDIYTPITRCEFDLTYYNFKSTLRNFMFESETLRILTPCVRGLMQKAPIETPPEDVPPLLLQVGSLTCEQYSVGEYTIEDYVAFLTEMYKEDMPHDYYKFLYEIFPEIEDLLPVVDERDESCICPSSSTDVLIESSRWQESCVFPKSSTDDLIDQQISDLPCNCNVSSTDQLIGHPPRSDESGGSCSCHVPSFDEPIGIQISNESYICEQSESGDTFISLSDQSSDDDFIMTLDKRSLEIHTTFKDIEFQIILSKGSFVRYCDCAGDGIISNRQHRFMNRLYKKLRNNEQFLRRVRDVLVHIKTGKVEQSEPLNIAYGFIIGVLQAILGNSHFYILDAIRLRALELKYRHSKLSPNEEENASNKLGTIEEVEEIENLLCKTCNIDEAVAHDSIVSYEEATSESRRDSILQAESNIIETSNAQVSYYELPSQANQNSIAHGETWRDRDSCRATPVSILAETNDTVKSNTTNLQSITISIKRDIDNCDTTAKNKRKGSIQFQNKSQGAMSNSQDNSYAIKLKETTFDHLFSLHNCSSCSDIEKHSNLASANSIETAKSSRSCNHLPNPRPVKKKRNKAVTTHRKIDFAQGDTLDIVPQKRLHKRPVHFRKESIEDLNQYRKTEIDVESLYSYDEMKPAPIQRFFYACEHMRVRHPPILWVLAKKLLKRRQKKCQGKVCRERPSRQRTTRTHSSSSKSERRSSRSSSKNRREAHTDHSNEDCCGRSRESPFAKSKGSRRRRRKHKQRNLRIKSSKCSKCCSSSGKRRACSSGTSRSANSSENCRSSSSKGHRGKTSRSVNKPRNEHQRPPAQKNRSTCCRDTTQKTQKTTDHLKYTEATPMNKNSSMHYHAQRSGGEHKVWSNTASSNLPLDDTCSIGGYKPTLEYYATDDNRYERSDAPATTLVVDASPLNECECSKANQENSTEAKSAPVMYEAIDFGAISPPTSLLDWVTHPPKRDCRCSTSFPRMNASTSMSERKLDNGDQSNPPQYNEPKHVQTRFISGKAPCTCPNCKPQRSYFGSGSRQINNHKKIALERKRTRNVMRTANTAVSKYCTRLANQFNPPPKQEGAVSKCCCQPMPQSTLHDKSTAPSTTDSCYAKYMAHSSGQSPAVSRSSYKDSSRTSEQSSMDQSVDSVCCSMNTDELNQSSYCCSQISEESIPSSKKEDLRNLCCTSISNKSSPPRSPPSPKRETRGNICCSEFAEKSFQVGKAEPMVSVGCSQITHQLSPVRKRESIISNERKHSSGFQTKHTHNQSTNNDKLYQNLSVNTTKQTCKQCDSINYSVGIPETQYDKSTATSCFANQCVLSFSEHYQVTTQTGPFPSQPMISNSALTDAMVMVDQQENTHNLTNCAMQTQVSFKPTNSNMTEWLNGIQVKGCNVEPSITVCPSIASTRLDTFLPRTTTKTNVTLMPIYRMPQMLFRDKKLHTKLIHDKVSATSELGIKELLSARSIHSSTENINGAKGKEAQIYSGRKMAMRTPTIKTAKEIVGNTGVIKLHSMSQTPEKASMSLMTTEKLTHSTETINFDKQSVRGKCAQTHINLIVQTVANISTPNYQFTRSFTPTVRKFQEAQLSASNLMVTPRSEFNTVDNTGVVDSQQRMLEDTKGGFHMKLTRVKITEDGVPVSRVTDLKKSIVTSDGLQNMNLHEHIVRDEKGIIHVKESLKEAGADPDTGSVLRFGQRYTSYEPRTTKKAKEVWKHPHSNSKGTYKMKGKSDVGMNTIEEETVRESMGDKSVTKAIITEDMITGKRSERIHLAALDNQRYAKAQAIEIIDIGTGKLKSEHKETRIYSIPKPSKKTLWRTISGKLVSSTQQTLRRAGLGRSPKVRNHSAQVTLFHQQFPHVRQQLQNNEKQHETLPNKSSSSPFATSEEFSNKLYCKESFPIRSSNTISDEIVIDDSPHKKLKQHHANTFVAAETNELPCCSFVSHTVVAATQCSHKCPLAYVGNSHKADADPSLRADGARSKAAIEKQIASSNTLTVYASNHSSKRKKQNQRNGSKGTNKKSCGRWIVKESCNDRVKRDFARQNFRKFKATHGSDCIEKVPTCRNWTPVKKCRDSYCSVKNYGCKGCCKRSKRKPKYIFKFGTDQSVKNAFHKMGPEKFKKIFPEEDWPKEASISIGKTKKQSITQTLMNGRIRKRVEYIFHDCCGKEAIEAFHKLGLKEFKTIYPQCCWPEIRETSYDSLETPITNNDRRIKEIKAADKSELVCKYEYVLKDCCGSEERKMLATLGIEHFTKLYPQCCLPEKITKEDRTNKAFSKNDCCMTPAYNEEQMRRKYIFNDCVNEDMRNAFFRLGEAEYKRIFPNEYCWPRSELDDQQISEKVTKSTKPGAGTATYQAVRNTLNEDVITKQEGSSKYKSCACNNMKSKQCECRKMNQTRPSERDALRCNAFSFEQYEQIDLNSILKDIDTHFGIPKSASDSYLMKVQPKTETSSPLSKIPQISHKIKKLLTSSGFTRPATANTMDITRNESTKENTALNCENGNCYQSTQRVMSVHTAQQPGAARTAVAYQEADNRTELVGTEDEKNIKFLEEIDVVDLKEQDKGERRAASYKLDIDGKPVIEDTDGERNRDMDDEPKIRDDTVAQTPVIGSKTNAKPKTETPDWDWEQDKSQKLSANITLEPASEEIPSVALYEEPPLPRMPSVHIDELERDIDISYVEPPSLPRQSLWERVKQTRFQFFRNTKYNTNYLNQIFRKRSKKKPRPVKTFSCGCNYTTKKICACTGEPRYGCQCRIHKTRQKTQTDNVVEYNFMDNTNIYRGSMNAHRQTGSRSMRDMDRKESCYHAFPAQDTLPPNSLLNTRCARDISDINPCLYDAPKKMHQSIPKPILEDKELNNVQMSTYEDAQLGKELGADGLNFTDSNFDSEKIYQFVYPVTIKVQAQGPKRVCLPRKNSLLGRLLRMANIPLKKFKSTKNHQPQNDVPSRSHQKPLDQAIIRYTQTSRTNTETCKVNPRNSDGGQAMPNKEEIHIGDTSYLIRTPRTTSSEGATSSSVPTYRSNDDVVNLNFDDIQELMKQSHVEQMLKLQSEMEWINHQIAGKYRDNALRALLDASLQVKEQLKTTIYNQVPISSTATFTTNPEISEKSVEIASAVHARAAQSRQSQPTNLSLDICQNCMSIQSKRSPSPVKEERIEEASGNELIKFRESIRRDRARMRQEESLRRKRAFKEVLQGCRDHCSNILSTSSSSSKDTCAFYGGKHSVSTYLRSQTSTRSVRDFIPQKISGNRSAHLVTKSWSIDSNNLLQSITEEAEIFSTYVPIPTSQTYSLLESTTPSQNITYSNSRSDSDNVRNPPQRHIRQNEIVRKFNRKKVVRNYQPPIEEESDSEISLTIRSKQSTNHIIIPFQSMKDQKATTVVLEQSSKSSSGGSSEDEISASEVGPVERKRVIVCLDFDSSDTNNTREECDSIEELSRSSYADNREYILNVHNYSESSYSSQRAPHNVIMYTIKPDERYANKPAVIATTGSNFLNSEQFGRTITHNRSGAKT